MVLVSFRMCTIAKGNWIRGLLVQIKEKIKATIVHMRVMRGWM